MGKMIFRLATMQDINVLIGFDTHASHDLHRHTEIREWCEAGVCHIAELAGEIVAYGVLHYHFYGYGFIDILMVDERFRRRGVGRKLLEQLKSLCERPKLFTSTNGSNLPMKRLLLEAGFTESGCIENLDENDPERVFFFPVKGTAS
ncbi:hypothetical protein ALQ63_03108 [Serratia plymuthica]|jgi:GNAT superfamily N-acetyltransferase|nr:hypothetical protein ALQ63_03108 [Serratia plymuthica]